MKKYSCVILLLIMITSCSDLIEIPNISEERVQLIAPADNAMLTFTALHLSWDVVEDAEQYEIQIALPDFEEALQIVIDSTLTENSILVQLEASTAYQWRVRASNNGYTTPYTTYSFVLE